MNEYEEVSFEAITYLTGGCNYRGRVTDGWDLTSTQHPEVFGMHENVYISKDLQQTKLLFDSLILTQGGGSKGGGGSGGDTTLLDIANDILSKVTHHS